MGKILNVFFALLFGVNLVGCSSFNKAMNLQDEYAKSILFTKTSSLIMEKSFSPSVIRGLGKKKFSAYLPEGVYIPVASSAGRNFYQAPENFEYRSGDIVESKVGGIVEITPNNTSKYYVWLFPHQSKYFQVEPNGEWIKEVKPGLSNIAARPWVEGDLVVEP